MKRLDELVAATPATRDRYVDFLRGLSILVVVVDHWLIAVIYWDDGVIGSTIGQTRSAGRNILDREAMAPERFTYVSTGRPPVCRGRPRDAWRSWPLQDSIDQAEEVSLGSLTALEEARR